MSAEERPLIHMYDSDTASEFFRECEPELREAVRKRMTPAMRAKFDSSDVVQSALMDCWRHFRHGRSDFRAGDNVHAYLRRATIRRLIDFIRHLHHPLDRDISLGGRDLTRPDDISDRDEAEIDTEELFLRLLNRCTPMQRQVMLARREGFSTAEIAAISGLHEASVRRIIRELGKTLTDFLKPREPARRDHEPDPKAGPDAPRSE